MVIVAATVAITKKIFITAQQWTVLHLQWRMMCPHLLVAFAHCIKDGFALVWRAKAAVYILAGLSMECVKCTTARS